MRTSVEFITAVAMIAWVGSAVSAESGTHTSGREVGSNASPGSFVYEGALAFQEDLPVDRVVGTSKYPELLVVKSIRLENTAGHAWSVTASVGWLPAKEITWQMKVELLDGNNQVLKNSGDPVSLFTAIPNDVNETSMRHATLKLSWITCRGRRHATRFRIHVKLLTEPSGGIDSVGGEMDPIEITVLDQESQKPMGDAVVIVGDFTYQDTDLPYQTIQVTNAQGRCQTRLPHKPNILLINAQKQGFSPITWENRPGSNLPERHVFEMRRGMSAGGIVQDSEGHGIASAEVNLQASTSARPGIILWPEMNLQGGMVSVSRCVHTDSEGRWKVEGLPFGVERIYLGIKHPDYGGNNGRKRRISGEALLNAQALNHSRVLAKGLTLTGNVYNDQGRPVERATVMLMQQSHDLIYTLTDESGGFRLMCSKDESDYRGASAVVVEAPDYAPALQPFDPQQNLRPLEFRLERGRTISFRVVNLDEQPIGGAEFSAKPLREHPYYDIRMEDTEKLGIFKVPNMPNNDVRFTIMKRGYVSARDFVAAASEDEVSIHLRRALQVRGKVVDAESGEQIPSFVITFVDSVQSMRLRGGRGDFTNGTYELSYGEAEPETLQLKASAAGYWSAISKEVKNEGSQHVIDFELTRIPGTQRLFRFRGYPD